MARSTIQRLANWVLAEAHKNASHGSIVVPFDRGTLASHIGTTRENLSQPRANDGAWCTHSRPEIVIDNKELLEIFARPQPLIDDPLS